MRPITIGKVTYNLDHQRDRKGRPGRALVATDASGNVVGEGYTRYEVEVSVRSRLGARA